MSTIFFLFCGGVSVVFFSDALAILFSDRYYAYRQKMLGFETKAPQHLDANKYSWVNKIFSIIASLGAGGVPLIWIWQNLNSY